MSVGKVIGLGSTILLVTGCQSWQYRDIDSLPPTAALPAASEPGKVEVRYFDGIGGATVADMTATPQYPDNPDEIAELNELERPTNRAENYGSFVRGFISPPATGEYRFFIYGNDEVQFWLSPTEQAADAEMTASTPAYTNVGDFSKYASQTSGLKYLTAGKRYYFQILHKEGSGSDHFGVAWEGPGIGQQIIGSQHIFSWGEPVYEDTVSSGEAYSLGYRVGFLDGTQGLSFNPDYPPLDNDQDGIYDNWEILHGLDPNNTADATSDPDGDFLAAADEFLIGTAEGNPDSDADGIPDGVEYAFGLDPLDQKDASYDLDGDGYSNLDEHLAGTELNNAEDAPVTAPEPQPEPTPEPTPEPEPEVTEPTYVAGFVAQYFSGRELNQLEATTIDRDVAFNWGQNAPIPELPTDQFSIRWNGIFTAPHSSGSNQYQFTVRTNDGVRLYANGQLVIDDWSEHAPRTFTYDRSLAAGEQLRLTVEYFENVGNAVAEYSATNLTTGEKLVTANTISSPDLTNPQSTDTDGDGIPDTWELSYGLNAWVADADDSNNNSQITNLEAYESGLHPYTLTSVSEPTTTEPETSAPPPTASEGSVTLSWTAPSTRMDGSSIALSEIDYYVINYGQNISSLSQSTNVDGAQTSYTFDGLASGTWHFTIRVVDTNGLTSAPSDPVSSTIP